MADIDALRKKYFVQPDDTSPPSEPLPATFGGCRVTPLIDGGTYFADLAAQIAALGQGTPSENSGQFLYIAGWWLHLLGGRVNPSPSSSGASTGPSVGLDNPFSLDGPGAPNHLVDLLKAKAAAGVDVRVLGWISFSVMADYFVLTASVQNGAGSIRDVNVGTMGSIRELRKAPALADKACLNIIAHSAGAVHAKMVLVGNGSTAIGYTGGLDLVGDRHGGQPHPSRTWHDVQAKVEGPAVQAMYDLYRSMWNELKARDIRSFRFADEKIASHTAATPVVPARTLPTTAVGKHHVQSLRTVPRFNYKTINLLPENKKISFAPDGLFEVRSAWFNAVLTAERYVYIEDQGFWSVEIMIWLNQALKARDDLKVILVCGATDPNDPHFPPYANVALFKGLLHDLNAQQRGRVRAFSRDVIVHTKSTIVDDHWAVIGSANAFRRSLYSDVEHAVGLLDEEDLLVQQYRVRLWSDAFGLLAPADQQKIADIDQALNVWNSAWGTPGSGVVLPSAVIPVPLPSTPTVLSEKDQDKYDRYADVDSREAWGGCLP
ncbi:phospholipase D family protein [Actinomadura fibrosa]|uniref:Phospholipase D family protein n=1 Tax=Actinomadura fibrosa TaxID=111802 RepID=A0ABW2XSS3_9ACTN|nr:phospholipase D family protein [Actinomadura fibrosa]